MEYYFIVYVVHVVRHLEMVGEQSESSLTHDV